MRLPPLKALIAFESVARTKSIAGAAEELALTPSAVSHQISSLEEILGRPLFSREGRGLKITPAGEKYLSGITGLLADLGRVTEEVALDEEPQALRLHCVPSFALLWLLPRLKSFSARYPQIEMKIGASYEEVSFGLGKYDIAIRYGYPNWPGLEIRSLRGEYVLPMASPEFLRAHPVSEISDLLRYRLISSETHLVQWSQWFHRYGIKADTKSFDYCFDRSYMALEAASLGMGIVLESSVLAANHLHSEKLKPVFAASERIEVLGHHIVFPHNTKIASRIQYFIDWISDESQGMFPR